MRVYLNDEKKSVDPRLHLKRVGIISRDHCDSQDPLSNNHYIATNVLLLSILTSLFQVTSNLTKMAIIITQSFNLGYFYFSSCLTLLEIDIFFLSLPLLEIIVRLFFLLPLFPNFSLSSYRLFPVCLYDG